MKWTIILSTCQGMVPRDEEEYDALRSPFDATSIFTSTVAFENNILGRIALMRPPWPNGARTATPQHTTPLIPWAFERHPHSRLGPTPTTPRPIWVGGDSDDDPNDGLPDDDATLVQSLLGMEESTVVEKLYLEIRFAKKRWNRFRGQQPFNGRRRGKGRGLFFKGTEKGLNPFARVYADCDKQHECADDYVHQEEWSYPDGWSKYFKGKGEEPGQWVRGIMQMGDRSSRNPSKSLSALARTAGSLEGATGAARGESSLRPKMLQGPSDER